MKRRNLLASLPFAFAAMGAAAPLFAQAFDPSGRFTPIQPPQPTETPGKVEVVDIFWYGCPHCYTFLPFMEEWTKTRPSHIAVRRMPAIFRDSWENHARAYYIAQQLGIEDVIHRPLFDAIHVDGRSLDKQDTLAAFFADKAGVATSEFDKTWTSFTIASLLQKSRVMQRNYGVRGTPSVVIGGKYVTSGSQAGSYPDMLKVVEALADRERTTI